MTDLQIDTESDAYPELGYSGATFPPIVSGVAFTVSIPAHAHEIS